MRNSLLVALILCLVPLLTATPASAQEFYGFGQGSILIGNDTATCNAARDGALRFNSATDAWNYCNGAAWVSFGGGGTPAGADREIQFNNAGAFGASSTFKLMADGDLLLSGTFTGTASVPVSGAGTRMFFDVQKAALRAGWINGAQWDNASIGNYSVAMGSNATASGQFSVALGIGVTASNWGAVALGDTTTASGNQSTASGERSTASGSGSVAMGADVSATNNQSIALGNEVDVTGQQAFGFGLTAGNATDPIVSGNQSLGIFMGNQNAVNFSAATTMGVFGGKMVIDSTVPATNLSADTELEIDGTLKISSGGESCDAAREGAIQYLAASDTFQVCATAGSWSALGGGAALSGLTAATGANTINNGANAQTWNWNSLTTGNGLSLGSNSVTSGNVLSVTNSNAVSWGSALRVASASGATAVYATNSGGAAIRGESSSLTGSGVAGSASGGNAVAIDGRQQGFGNTGYGGWFGNYNGGNVANYGVYGETDATGAAYGVYGRIYGASNTGYGVYGNNASATAGSYGVYCNSGRAAGCGGNQNWTNASDARLKELVADLPAGRGLEAIMKLRPVTYHWKDKKLDEANGQRIGLIAQDVEEVFPESVGTGNKTVIDLGNGRTQSVEGTKNLAYSDLVVPLIKAVQQQQGQIEELKAANDNLRQDIEKLKAAK